VATTTRSAPLATALSVSEPPFWEIWIWPASSAAVVVDPPAQGGERSPEGNQQLELRFRAPGHKLGDTQGPGVESDGGRERQDAPTPFAGPEANAPPRLVRGFGLEQPAEIVDSPERLVRAEGFPQFGGHERQPRLDDRPLKVRLRTERDLVPAPAQHLPDAHIRVDVAGRTDGREEESHVVRTPQGRDGSRLGSYRTRPLAPGPTGANSR